MLHRVMEEENVLQPDLRYLYNNLNNKSDVKPQYEEEWIR